MTQPLAEYVASQIRAEMARRLMSAAQLGRLIGVDETWVRRRIRGVYEITMSDLERIAVALELPVSFFMRPDEVSV